MSKINWNKIIFGLLIWAMGLALLLSLWQWQLKRLEWKDALLQRMEIEQERQPPFFTDVAIWMTDRAKEHHLKRVLFERSGAQTNRPQQFILLKPRMKDGQEGAHIYTVLESNSTVMPHIIANLGWARLSDIDEIIKSEKLNNAQQLTGFFVKAAEKTGQNFPEKNIWLHANIKDMAEFFDISADRAVNLGHFFYSETRLHPKITPHDYSQIELRNDHAYYASFWLSMSVVWSVILLTALFGPMALSYWQQRMKKPPAA